MLLTWRDTERKKNRREVGRKVEMETGKFSSILNKLKSGRKLKVVVMPRHSHLIFAKTKKLLIFFF